MAKYLLIKVAAFNDPADPTSDAYWGFNTRTVGEVNSLDEAIKLASNDLEISAADRFDYDMEDEVRQKKINEFLTQDIDIPFESEEVLDEYLAKYKMTTVYNARYFDDETGSEDINEYDIIKL